MATGFTPRERESIQESLREAAARHAAQAGLKKTSVDELCAEAGISKGAFYTFYQTKEHLFLDVLERWHQQISFKAEKAMRKMGDVSGPERAAAMMKTAWRAIREQGLDRFSQEAIPYLMRKLPEESVMSHSLTDAAFVHEIIQKTDVRLSVSEEEAYAMAKILFLSLYNARQVGAAFETALDTLIDCACRQIVEP